MQLEYIETIKLINVVYWRVGHISGNGAQLGSSVESKRLAAALASYIDTNCSMNIFVSMLSRFSYIMKWLSKQRSVRRVTQEAADLDTPVARNPMVGTLSGQ